MKLFLVVFTLILIACNPKQNKEVVKEEVIQINELKPIVDEIPKKVIFCKKIFEREEKLSFINNVYMAFVTKDSSLIQPYINITASVDIENSTLSGYSAKSISQASLRNWSSFVNEISPKYGVSVCTKLEGRTADFAVNSCWNETKGDLNTAYLKYIHFEKINGQYVIKGIGFYRG
jgi:hypothetical protein